MKKEYDFSKGKRVSPNRVYPSPKLSISIRLDPHVVAALKDEAEALGIGYQTLIGNVLQKHVMPETESFEEKFMKKVLERLEELGVPIKEKKSKRKKTA